MKSMMAAMGAMPILAIMAVANAADVPPVVKDLAPGYDFAGGTPPDILGFYAGMPREEAAAKLQADFPQGSWVSDEVDYIVSDDYGSEYPFRYYREDHGQFSGEDQESYIALRYSPGVAGARLMGIERRTKYSGTRPDFTETKNAVTAKYGAPSYVQEAGNNAIMVWVWSDGALLADDGSTYDAVMNCWQITQAVAMFQTYEFASSGARNDLFPQCTAVLEMVVTGNSAEVRINGIETRFKDYRRFHDSATMMDEVATAALAAQTPEPAPSPSL